MLFSLAANMKFKVLCGDYTQHNKNNYHTAVLQILLESLKLTQLKFYGIQECSDDLILQKRYNSKDTNWANMYFWKIFQLGKNQKQ